MKYGQGFWVVKDGVRIKAMADAYPEGLKPFLYDDGDLGWFLTRPFTVDYVKPGDSMAWRITIAGRLHPALHVNSFDFDGASVPQWKLLRAAVRDKMDRRWIVAALLHDLGHTIHEYVTGFSRSDWNELLSEVAEAYGENAYERGKYKLGVDLFGWTCYKKTEQELATYRKLVLIERVPL